MTTKPLQEYSYCVYTGDDVESVHTCAVGVGYAINDRASVFVVRFCNDTCNCSTSITIPPPKGFITLQKMGSDGFPEGEVRVMWKNGRDRNYILEESNAD